MFGWDAPEVSNLMVDTKSCIEWADFIPVEYRKYIADEIGDKIANMWSWLDDVPELPNMYPDKPINVKYCRFSPKMRHQKMFCGHNFKIGGHKE